MRTVVVGRRSQPAAIERVYTVKKTKKGKKIVAKDHLLDDEIDTPTWAKKRERPNDSLEDWVAGPDVEPGEATTKKQRRGKVCGYFLSVERAFDVLQTQNDFLREWKEEPVPRISWNLSIWKHRLLMAAVWSAAIHLLLIAVWTASTANNCSVLAAA
jgi:hypothetical protein